MRLENNEVKKSKSSFAIVSETYKDFAENTSIHGLKYTVNNKIGHYEKIFWFAVVISGLCAAGYMTVLFWERYADKPIRTTILTAYASTTAMPFPAVTICNVNLALRSKVESFLKELDLNETEEDIVRRVIPKLLTLDSAFYSYSESELNTLKTILEKNNYYDVTDLLPKISQECNEMLLNCAWKRKTISCLESFKRIITINGLCCSFGIGTTIYSPYNDPNSGLRVLLNPMSQTGQNSGFKVIVHDPSDSGSQAVSKIIPQGKIAYFGITGVKTVCSEDIKNIPIKQRHCLFSDESKLKYSRKYSTSNCAMECNVDMYYKSCGCVPFYFNFLGKPVCKIWESFCIHSVMLNKLTSRKNTCHCYSQCEHLQYDIRSTSSDMIYNEGISMMKFENTSIPEDPVLLNVHFLGDTQTILQTKTITSTIYLLSSFGGVYSLFMGCSLLTIVEIIYYFLFRFVINMKLFGKVDTDVEYTSRNKIRENQKIIYGNVLLP